MWLEKADITNVMQSEQVTAAHGVIINYIGAEGQRLRSNDLRNAKSQAILLLLLIFDRSYGVLQ
jgi:hypothetical protein